LWIQLSLHSFKICKNAGLPATQVITNWHKTIFNWHLALYETLNLWHPLTPYQKCKSNIWQFTVPLCWYRTNCTIIKVFFQIYSNLKPTSFCQNRTEPETSGNVTNINYSSTILFQASMMVSAGRLIKKENKTLFISRYQHLIK
jgi:hypothetical protein